MLVRPASAAADPLTLPPAWTPPPRPPLPIVAAVVPIVGAAGLWFVTGSVLSLWLAALGPLIAVATMADAARSARKDRRRHDAAAAEARAEVAVAIERRHDDERRRARTRHPDVAAFATRSDDVWRSAPGRADALVIGEGELASDLRISGGEGDPDAAALRARAARLSFAPVAVPASHGVAVVGPPVLTAAVQRALVLQLCLALPPGELSLVGPLRGDCVWAERLPHRMIHGALRVAIVASGETVPGDADIAIARCVPGEPIPPRCGAVLTVTSLHVARLDHSGDSIPVRVEAVALEQAAAIAEQLAARAERTLGITEHDAGPVLLGSLAVEASAARRDALAAVIGLDHGEPAHVDLVADGPHAVVAGVTGSGKSELLITWILALCRTHSPGEVTFLLADFKGGTAFDGLAGLPHVTGVITDLDGVGARRAIESLRAEVRWREGVIAGAGARDILDPRVELPRLVVVVDEFAALLGDHPELGAVFADVAARGRALGIHLILGTQRAAGVIRESLLANCPLRVSLRVTDAADSRTVLGTDDAALLPGGPAGRGHAYLRRAVDTEPRRIRIALSDRSDVEAIVRRDDGVVPRRPWLPALPQRLSLAELRASEAGRAGGGAGGASAGGGGGGAGAGGGTAGGILLGLADEPERQRQRAMRLSLADRALLVAGGPGSGTTNALALVAAQAQGLVLRVPADPEGLWDAVDALSSDPPPAGTVVVIDDLDAVATRLPPDHAREVLERLEDVLRRGGADGVLVVAGVHRVSGAVARLADLFPRRLLLPFPSRNEHIAAGGDAQVFDPAAPAGRGIMDGVLVQVAVAPEAAGEWQAPPAEWEPTAPLTGFVSRRSPAARDALAAWERRGIRSASVDDYAADPSVSAEGPLVLVGEPDDWQRHWRLLADVRGDHDLVVDSSCGAEYRLLTASRALPPYCEPGRARAWLMSAGGDPGRIVLPSAQVRPVRRPGHP